ncbi:MAG: hypothetical protein QXT27_06475 [Pyrobaculum sp.]
MSLFERIRTPQMHEQRTQPAQQHTQPPQQAIRQPREIWYGFPSPIDGRRENVGGISVVEHVQRREQTPTFPPAENVQRRESWPQHRVEEARMLENTVRPMVDKMIQLLPRGRWHEVPQPQPIDLSGVVQHQRRLLMI